MGAGWDMNSNQGHAVCAICSAKLWILVVTEKQNLSKVRGTKSFNYRSELNYGHSTGCDGPNCLPERLRTAPPLLEKGSK